MATRKTRSRRSRAPAHLVSRQHRQLPSAYWGFFGLAAGALALVFLIDPGGALGQGVSLLLTRTFGLAADVMAALLLVLGLVRLIGRAPTHVAERVAAWLLTLAWLPVVAVAAVGHSGGGAYGQAVWQALALLAGAGGRVVLIVLWPLLATLLWDHLWPAKLARTISARPRPARREPVPPRLSDPAAPEPALDVERPTDVLGPTFGAQGTGGLFRRKPQVSSEPAAAEDENPGPPPVVVDFPQARQIGIDLLPPLTLLEAPGALRAAPDPAGRARLLKDTLASFGVEVKVLDTVSGPAITRFEVQPAAGVKVSRVLALADDIALAMAAQDVRIEAPIPGKAAIGIEVPNTEVSPVLLREVLEAPVFQTSPSRLTIALGKDITGRPLVAALDRMPHLLIAGATGSGKSMLLNCIILSLLFRNRAAETQFVMIDPKGVELAQFAHIPHLLHPVVTDVRQAAKVLRHMLRTMDERYRLFAEAGVRDLERYNETLSQPLPTIVVVIDELADLMMVSPVEVEESICRLAQMARAAGIHLVVATQRPSVDVITGLIKANIPSRIACAVSSQADSRTILDQNGAEKLLGRGDMLYSPIGRAKPVRAQGAYVADDDLAAVVSFLRQQGSPHFDQALQQAAAQVDEEDEEALDPLFFKSLRVAVESHQISASLLQRRLRVGYAHAARIVEQLERKGYVGPADGARPREVRLSIADYEQLVAGRDEAD
ncbi:MAG: DNA translocase FtsK [Sulfobacillus sp.]